MKCQNFIKYIRPQKPLSDFREIKKGMLASPKSLLRPQGVGKYKFVKLLLETTTILLSFSP